MTTTSTAFPIGSAVIIHNLVNKTKYNGRHGTVVSPLDKTSLRQDVLIDGLNERVAIKPVNLHALQEIHEKMATSSFWKDSDVPRWYQELVTPNDGNQFIAKGGVNRKRKPDLYRHMLGIDSDTYWQGGGKYQELFDEFVNSLPPQGKAPTKAGEVVRAANKLMYDLWNNHMMNNTSSALSFLARQGIFPTGGGDTIYATIYPYSLGPTGNTPYIPIEDGLRRDDLTNAIESMIDKSCKFIFDNPHLKTETNAEDMTIGPQMMLYMMDMIRKMSAGAGTDGNGTGQPPIQSGAANDESLSPRQDFDIQGAMLKLQLFMELGDDGGCNHGRPQISSLGEDGYHFASFCHSILREEEVQVELTLSNLEYIFALTMSSGKYSNLFKDTEKMRLVLAFLSAEGTSAYLEGDADKAAGRAAMVMAFEDTEVFDEGRLMELLHPASGGSREHSIRNFFTAQIPCSCLDQSESRALCHKCKRVDRSNLLLQCSACFNVSYCSKECQRADWKSHKKSCKRTNPKK